MKPIKLSGRKPSKIIVPPGHNKPENERHFRKLISHDGLIITTDGKAIYDGKHKSL